MRPALCGLGLVLGCGCPAEPEEPPGVAVGDVIGAATVVAVAPPCGSPVDGWDRLTEDGAASGLQDPLGTNIPQTVVPGLVVFDLDLDGDLDVVLLHGQAGGRRVALWENLGAGTFAHREVPSFAGLAADAPHAGGLAAADLDGDALPELLMIMPGELRVAHNEGGFSFSAFTPWYQHGIEPPPTWSSFTLGDPDGDGDLDALITSTFAEFTTGGPAHGEQGALPPAGPEVLLRNDDGAFVLDRLLQPRAGPMYAQIAAMTDVDSDGDLDILVPSEFGGLDGARPTALYRNDGMGDGGVLLEDVAETLRIDWDLGGMGLDTWDANGDGAKDFCVVQVGPMVCALSSGDGRFLHSGEALGLERAPAEDWSGYSLEVTDLDDDGWLDAVAAGGDNQPGGSANVDRIWQGMGEGRFLDRSFGARFASDEEHFGLVAADVDGDLRVDVVVSGLTTPTRLWRNVCSAGHMLEVELQGPPGNAAGFGAEVRVTVAGQMQMREVFHLRAAAQGPPRVHFGLGEAEAVDEIEVRWPDGRRTVVEGPVPTGTRVRVAW